MAVHSDAVVTSKIADPHGGVVGLPRDFPSGLLCTQEANPLPGGGLRYAPVWLERAFGPAGHHKEGDSLVIVKLLDHLPAWNTTNAINQFNGGSGEWMGSNIFMTATPSHISVAHTHTPLIVSTLRVCLASCEEVLCIPATTGLL